MGMCFPLSAVSTADWSMYSKPRSWGRRSTSRVFPFLDVFLILNESSAMAPETQPRQSSGVVAAAASASAAAAAAAAAAASASSSTISASGMPSPFFPASKNLFSGKGGDERQIVASALRRRVVASSGISRVPSSPGLIHTLL